MSTSLRSRRMARNHQRMARPAKLNLVALMDIFTILVLFLIVNNGDVEVLQADKNVSLPESVSEQRPEPALTIKVTATDIIVQGRSVTTIEDTLNTSGETLTALEQALQQTLQEAHPANSVEADHPNGLPVVIMGDKDTPYWLLKRIIATCALTNYRDVALAVNSVPTTSAPDSVTLAGTGVAP